jgi:hypothetical protein
LLLLELQLLLLELQLLLMELQLLLASYGYLQQEPQPGP